MTIEERLEKVEKELIHAKRRNRWLLTTVGVTIIGLGLAWLLTKATTSATAATTQKEIHANQFILEDMKGKLFANLYITKFGSGLSLRGLNGKARAGLDVIQDEVMLWMNDANGKRRIWLDMSNGPKLELYDANGEVIWKAP